MPLIRTIQIYPENYRAAKIGIWRITEAEAFFRASVKVECFVTHPHKRLQHLAARYLLTELEPEFPLQEIVISKSRKPYLPHNAIYFSLAHCGDYAVAITSRKYRVGIDVEGIGPKIERVATKFLNQAELDFLSVKRQREHLTVCWSAKEAVFKWYGIGGVDFKENIQLKPFQVMNYGIIQCVFQKGETEKKLSLFYQIENDFVVTWLIDEEAT